MSDFQIMSIKRKREQFTIEIRKRKNMDYFRKSRQMIYQKKLREHNENIFDKFLQNESNSYFLIF